MSDFDPEEVEALAQGALGPQPETDEAGNVRWKWRGRLHRDDGPAVEWSDGTKSWYVDGKRHRKDGPAVEGANGSKEWWVNDKPVAPFTAESLENEYTLDPEEVEAIATADYGPPLTWTETYQDRFGVFNHNGEKLAKFAKRGNEFELLWIMPMVRYEFVQISRARNHMWSSPEEIIQTIWRYTKPVKESDSICNPLALVANLLFENRVKAAMKKYPGIDEKTWEIFTKNDPSGGRQKYLDWIGKSWSATPEEDRPEAENVIKWVKELHKRKVDVNSLGGLYELETKATGEMMGGKRKSIMRGAKIFQDDADFLVVSPQTHEASKFYGGSTKWCVATSNLKYWYDYNKQGALVYIKNRHLDPSNSLWKIAIYWQDGDGWADPELWEWYDTQDKVMEYGEKLDVWNELPETTQEKIKEYFEYCEPYEHAYELEEELVDSMWAEENGRARALKELSKMVDPEGRWSNEELERLLNEVTDNGAEQFLRFLHYEGYYDYEGQFSPDQWGINYEFLEGRAKDRGDDQEIDVLNQLKEMNTKGTDFLDIVQNHLDHVQFRDLIRYWGEENLRERLGIAEKAAIEKRDWSRLSSKPKLNVYSFEQVMDILRTHDYPVYDYLLKLSTAQESSATNLVGRLMECASLSA